LPKTGVSATAVAELKRALPKADIYIY
jgi:hypothetical protein